MNQLEATVAQLVEELRGLVASELLASFARISGLTDAQVATLVERLRALLAEISALVPATVAREQFLHPEPGRVSGARWNGSVLFADLSGFTALSGQLSALGKQGAEEVSAIISALFVALIEEVQRYAGVPLKFGGDALTAFFDAASLGDLHAGLAARAARSMQQRMASFVDLRTPAGTFTLRLRIGVHSGEVFAAQIGDASHIELVVTGHDINRVALAQEIAEPGEVVVSAETLALAPGLAAEERRAGFFAIADAPDISPPTGALRLEWPNGAGDIGEAIDLARCLVALRPYLPHALPRRFLTPATSPAEAGEFRPVTVLFANFADFSHALDGLAGHHQLAADLINAYYRRAQQIVHRYGGIVNKVDIYTHGDKLMALFGAPTAHEDDPERAIRCAIELQRALADANAEIGALLATAGAPAMSFAFSQKIGINTGAVFAGQVGSRRRFEYTVMGQPVNIAARLMSAAPAGSIVVSPATRRAVESRFAFRDLPPVILKGIAEPVPLAEPIRPLESGQHHRHGIERAPLVGRAPELAQLVECAARALGGVGQLVTIIGEAGIGKTRIVEELVQQLVVGEPAASVPPFLLFGGECQSYDQTTPYAAIRPLLAQVLRLPLGTITLAAVERRVLDLAPELVRFAPLLGAIIGAQFADTSLTTALGPQQRHDRAVELVEALLLGEATLQPLVVVIDDIHWADASSLDIITRLARRVGEAPLLLLLLYRATPPIASPWQTLPNLTTIRLGEMSAAASLHLLYELLSEPPEPALTIVVERAQGNPFYLEEVVRGLVESGTLVRSEAGRWQLTRALDDATIPPSIEGVITARLDRLDDQSRDIVQVASVIGRRFGFHVLDGVLARRPELRTVLSQLVSDDLVAPESAVGTEQLLREFLFRHALTRDVAYESVLYARRRELHRRVARQIAFVHKDRIEEQLALLAGHYLLAEEWDRAFDFHLRAGLQAQERFANREAIALLGRALQLAEHPPESFRPELRPDAPTIAAELHERLGTIHTLLGEYDAALEQFAAALSHTEDRQARLRLHYLTARVYERRAAFELAFEWVERSLAIADDASSEDVAQCLLLGAGLHRRKGRYQQSLEWGERARAMAESIGSIRYQADADMLLGGTIANLGDSARAVTFIRRSLELYGQLQNLPRLADAHNDLATLLWPLGQLDDARRELEVAAQIKAMVGDVYGQGMVACNLGELLRTQGHVDAAIPQYQRAIAIFEQLDSPYMRGVAEMNLGAASIVRGDLSYAETHLSRASALFERAGAEEFLPELERYWAELALQRGDLAAAHAACGRSLDHANRLEARGEAGMTRRILALTLVALGQPAAAWAEIERSIALLREADSRLDLARALIVQADLAPDHGQRMVGQCALHEAIDQIHRAGALYLLDAATAVAARHGYAPGEPDGSIVCSATLDADPRS